MNGIEKESMDVAEATRIINVRQEHFKGNGTVADEAALVLIKEVDRLTKELKFITELDTMQRNRESLEANDPNAPMRRS